MNTLMFETVDEQTERRKRSGKWMRRVYRKVTEANTSTKRGKSEESHSSLSETSNSITSHFNVRPLNRGTNNNQIRRGTRNQRSASQNAARAIDITACTRGCCADEPLLSFDETHNEAHKEIPLICGFKDEFV